MAPIKPISSIAYVSVIFHFLSDLWKFYDSVALYLHSPICLYEMHKDNFTCFASRP